MLNMKIIKRIVGVFTGIICFASVVLAFTHGPIAVFLLEAVSFGIPTFFLMKPKRKKTSSEEPEEPKEPKEFAFAIPEETLKAMKTVSSPVYSDSYVRVIQESIQLMKTTKNIETLCSRYEVALQKAYNLKAWEQSGVSKTSPDADYYISWLYSNYHKCIKTCYDRFIHEVKTENGKENRRKKFFNDLAKHVDEFELQDIHEFLQ